MRIYLDEIEDWQDQPLAVGLALLTVVSDAEIVERARRLLDQGTAIGQQRDIIEWVSTIMIYRFPQLGWEGVEAMFNIQDVRLEDTRAYQEIAEKRDKTVKSSFLLELLTGHLGDLPETVAAQIPTMSPERLSDLGKAMFGLRTVEDLEVWLAESR